ncbi:MAG: DUF4442 domain-containing protein [Saprospiraceae bacterium]|nr:DUF4442 domain-containing protein [Saprospiraceae bacterium]
MSSNILPAKSKLIANLNTPWKMRLYFWQRLPSLLFWGVKIKYCDTDKVEITIPFSWRTQNPFRSTYFAALCGAAELSTGTLGLIAIEGRGRISMLITHIEAEFYKKATGLTTFTCEEGKKIQDTVQKTMDSGEAQQIRVTSVGTNTFGEIVTKVTLTWSFKKK